MSRVAWPLTIYYDAACALCREEMHALAVGDIEGRLRLHDISLPEALDRHCHEAGLDHAALMEAIHARDAGGAWFRGIAVFELAYGAAGLAGLAALFGNPWLRPWWERLYPWIARNRQALSRLRLDRPYGWLVRRAALRAQRRARACSGGSCPFPGKQESQRG